jgi:hypothetical protein
MERDRWPSDDPELRGGSDVGRDLHRDHGDEPPPGWRDSPPDPLAPIDPGAPVSGHVPAREAPASPHEAPEHDWSVAATLIYPLLRPPGTTGLQLEGLDAQQLVEAGMKVRAEALVDEGPAGLAVVYGIAAGGFDVIVNADHVLSWGVSPADIQDAALHNLEAWSATAPWSDERSDHRRLLSSQSGDGWDASRILLLDVVEHLVRELGAGGRVLVGLPERHLLVAGTLHPDDPEFAALLADFVVEQSGSADEPVDRRLFEIASGRLVLFSG